MLMNRIIGFDRSPIQYGMEWNAEHYIEKHVYFRGHRMLYYQFQVHHPAGEIPVVPDGCIDIMFSCDASDPRAYVYGTVLQGKTIRFVPNATYFCVRFTPKQSMCLHSLPFRDVVNSDVALAEAFKETAACCERLISAPTFEERIAVFERSFLAFLLSPERSQSSKLVDYSLERIYLSGGTLATEQLAAECGYSPRYLRRCFDETLGISPKLFSRIIRFQNSLSMLLHSDAADAGETYDQHFYDQSHFLKEFKHFSLFSPSQIRKIKQSQKRK